MFRRLDRLKRLEQRAARRQHQSVIELLPGETDEEALRRVAEAGGSLPGYGHILLPSGTTDIDEWERSVAERKRREAATGGIDEN